MIIFNFDNEIISFCYNNNFNQVLSGSVTSIVEGIILLSFFFMHLHQIRKAMPPSKITPPTVPKIIAKVWLELERSHCLV